jgi:hypothetical protein
MTGWVPRRAEWEHADMTLAELADTGFSPLCDRHDGWTRLRQPVDGAELVAAIKAGRKTVRCLSTNVQ